MAALPPEVLGRLEGVDLILHAGDVDDPAILDELGQIAPVEAVRGNWHVLAPWPNDQRLPLFLELEIEAHRIVVTHGHLNLWNSFLEKFWLFLPDRRRRINRIIVTRLAHRFPGADVYVFGHTHRALVERRGGALFVNPGAVCPARGQIASMGRLVVTRCGVEAEIVPLTEMGGAPGVAWP
jgi:putative phosphoesterase